MLLGYVEFSHTFAQKPCSSHAHTCEQSCFADTVKKCVLYLEKQHPLSHIVALDWLLPMVEILTDG